MRRREATHRKTLHGQLANRIIAQSITVKTEKLSYKAWQKIFGCYINVRAPELLVSILTRKAESGRLGHRIQTLTTALSQVCLWRQNRKKRLSERIHACTRGVMMQRDLFNANLVRLVKDDALQVAKARESWPGAEPPSRFLGRLGHTCRWLGNRQPKTNLQVDGSCLPPRPLS